jgi:type VI secretion system protein ImpK
MKKIALSHHGAISEEFDIFYYELLRIKEMALKSVPAPLTANEDDSDDSKIITVSGPALALQERLTTFFDKQKERFHRSAVGPSSLFIQEAQYVFVTLADEVMINIHWHGSDYWRQNCLETKIFQTQVAGERIFSQIDNLFKKNDPLQRELARVYLLTLSLGFQGRFRSLGISQILSYKQQLFSFIYHRSANLTQGSRDYILDDSLKFIFTEAPTKGLPDLRSWSITAFTAFLIYLFVSYGIWTIISADLHQVLQSIFHLAKQGPVV